MRRDAFVVNRVHRRPRCNPSPEEVVHALELHRLRLGPKGDERLLRALDDERRLAEVDAVALAELGRALSRAASGPPPVRIEIPALPSDVHDIPTLGGIAALLCPP